MLDRVVAGLAVVTLAAGLAGCTSQPPGPSITVLAAASLRPTFTEIAERFEADHPGVTVKFDFAGSADLAAQLTQGAVADVFASADTAQMDTVARAGLVAGEPVRFASNSLVIVTAPGNPKHVGSFSDLVKPGLAVVVSPPPMPCGVAIQRVEASTGVHLDPVSAEPDAEDVLNKVIAGEADAGLVNVTDALAVGDRVTAVRFPEAADAVTSYPIAALKGAAQPGLASAFVDFAASGRGQEILQRAGFGPP